MTRHGVRHAVLRALLAKPDTGRSATELQGYVPHRLAHKPHITEELVNLRNLGVVTPIKDGRVTRYQVNEGQRLPAVHLLYDVGRDRLPKVVGAAASPDIDEIRRASNELVSQAPVTRGDLSFSHETLFAQTGTAELKLLNQDFIVARARLRDVQAARGSRKPIRRRRDDYHKDGARDIQSVVLEYTIGAEVVEDARTGPMSLAHVETGLQFSDVDLTSMPLSSYIVGREQLLSNDLVPVSLGRPWSQHAIITREAKRASIIDTVYTVGCSVLSPKVRMAFRAHGIQIEGAMQHQVAFEDAANQMETTAGRRVAFLMEAHMAIPLRTSQPAQYEPMFTVVDQGVQLIRASSFAPWLVGSAEDFRRRMRTVFSGRLQEQLMDVYAPIHFARKSDAVVPGLPESWRSDDVNNPTQNRRLSA